MSTESLLSGMIGALIATVLAVLYQHLSALAQRRFEVLLLAVDYLDDLYFNFRYIEQYKERKYQKNREVMSNDEYHTLCNKTDSMLTSSRIHARVAMVYGENSGELEKFNTLRTKLTETTIMLFQACPDTWDQTSASIHRVFEEEIEPLRHTTELELIRGANMWSVFRDMLRFSKRKKSSNTRVE